MSLSVADICACFDVAHLLCAQRRSQPMLLKTWIPRHTQTLEPMAVAPRSEGNAEEHGPFLRPTALLQRWREARGGGVADDLCHAL
jgi:hypothetical protein